MVENSSQGDSLRFIIYNNKPLNHLYTESLDSLNKPIKPLNQYEQESNTRFLLDSYRAKQSFRVSKGKTHWEQYETFKPKYDLREVLNDEIIIEFDNHEDWTMNWKAINETAINLFRAGISFEIWDHKGKSPHLHIHDLPIADLTKEKRAIFKKIFIRTYVPLEYLPYVDLSLTGIHLVAIEWVNHWKGCYDVKRLLSKFDPTDTSHDTTEKEVTENGN